jgi:hypothetical protein
MRLFPVDDPDYEHEQDVLLAAIAYRPLPKTRIPVLGTRHLLDRVERLETGSETKEQVPWLVFMFHSQWSVEHIFPQRPKLSERPRNANPDNWDFFLAGSPTPLNMLGNLVALEQPLNARASNHMFHVKVTKAYEHSQFSSVQRLTHEMRNREWTRQVFLARHRRLVRMLLTDMGYNAAAIEHADEAMRTLFNDDEDAEHSDGHDHDNDDGDDLDAPRGPPPAHRRRRGDY